METRSFLIVLIACTAIIASCCNGRSHSQLAAPPLYSARATNCFSSSVKKDTFIISLSGKDTLEGNITFAIISYKGDTIWKDQFKGRYLLDYGSIDLTTDRQRAAYVIEKMETFFAKENFIKPSLADLTKQNKAFYNKVYIREFKKDKSSTGFAYGLADEDYRIIGYSRKLKKVILYYNCC